MLEGLKAKIKNLFTGNDDQKKAEKAKAVKGQNNSAIKTSKQKVTPIFDANLEDEINQGLRLEHKKKEEYEPDEYKEEKNIKQAKNPLLDKLDKQLEDLEKTRKEQGLIGRTWDWIKNKTKKGAGSNKVLSQINSEKEFVKQVLSGQKVDAKKFKEITGLEYNTANINKFKNGEVELLSTKKLKDYQEGQEMVLDVTADLAAGLMAGIGVVASPFTGGTSLLLAAGAGAAVKTGLKYSDAKVGGRKYNTFTKDVVTGGITGLLTPITAGAGGAVANVLTRTIGKNLVGRGAAFIGEQAVAGAIFGGGAEGVNEAFSQIQKNEFDGKKIISKTLEGTGGGAIGGVIMGGTIKGAGKMFKIPFNKIGEFFKFNKKTKTVEQKILHTKNKRSMPVDQPLDNFKQKSVEILKDGTKKVTGQLKWLTKDGTQLEYTLEKQYKTTKDSTDILYNVMDKDGTTVGEWFGYVISNDGKNTLHGYSLYTHLSNKNTRGLGTELKKLILKEAKEYNCKSIEILASFESHTFHNKTGYKCDINETYLAPILATLKKIRKIESLPMFNERIDLALRDTNIPQINELLDDILTEANAQGLRSSDIGISQIKIPMKLDLH